MWWVRLAQRVPQYYPGEIDQDEAAAERGDLADQERSREAAHDEKQGAGARCHAGPPRPHAEDRGAEHEQQQSKNEEGDGGDLESQPEPGNRGDHEEQQTSEARAKAPPLEPPSLVGVAGVEADEAGQHSHPDEQEQLAVGKAHHVR